jgi:DUF1707 SHOCT-like domain
MTHPNDPREPSLSLPVPAAAPAAREQAVEALTQLFAHDQITETDLEQRLDRVYRAGTAAELAAVIADLPAVLPVGKTATVAAETGQRITALLSGQQRGITGVVPRELELRARLGHVELDLTHATFAPGITWIDARAFMGYVQIRFPAGVRVESDGRAFAGFFAIKGAGSGDPRAAASVVRVTGRAVFGFAECFVASEFPPGEP